MSHGSKLITFLYFLALDELPWGTVERAVKDAIERPDNFVPSIGNSELVQIAERWARELGGEPELVEELGDTVIENEALLIEIKRLLEIVEKQRVELKRLYNEGEIAELNQKIGRLTGERDGLRMALKKIDGGASMKVAFDHYDENQELKEEIRQLKESIAVGRTCRPPEVAWSGSASKDVIHVDDDEPVDPKQEAEPQAKTDDLGRPWDGKMAKCAGCKKELETGKLHKIKALEMEFYYLCDDCNERLKGSEPMGIEEVFSKVPR